MRYKLSDFHNTITWFDGILAIERSQFTGNNMDTIVWAGKNRRTPAIVNRAAGALKHGGALILPKDMTIDSGQWVYGGTVGRKHHVYFLGDVPDYMREANSDQQVDVGDYPALQQAEQTEEDTGDDSPGV